MAQAGGLETGPPVGGVQQGRGAPPRAPRVPQKARAAAGTQHLLHAGCSLLPGLGRRPSDQAGAHLYNQLGPGRGVRGGSSVQRPAAQTPGLEEVTLTGARAGWQRGRKAEPPASVLGTRGPWGASGGRGCVRGRVSRVTEAFKPAWGSPSRKPQPRATWGGPQVGLPPGAGGGLRPGRARPSRRTSPVPHPALPPHSLTPRLAHSHPTAPGDG